MKIVTLILIVLTLLMQLCSAQFGIPMGGGMRGNGRYNNRGRGNDWNNLGTNEFGYNGMGRRYEPNMFIPGFF